VSARRWARALAGLIVAALFLGLLARRVEWTEVRRVLAGARWLPLGLALLALAADMGARITRWWWMLRAAQPDLAWSRCVRPFLGSLALNNTVPLRAGDVVRVFGFRLALQAPAAHVAGTLVLERILDLLVLLAILFAATAGSAGQMPHGFVVFSSVAGALALAALLALTLFPDAICGLSQRVLDRLFRGKSWLPRVSSVAAQLTASLGLLRRPALAARLLASSVVAWLLEGTVFACVAWSLGIAAHPIAPWLSLAAGTLATLIPSSPGYVGTFDYFASLGLRASGTLPADAAAFALLTHLVLWLPVTVAGLMALLFGRGVPQTESVTLHTDSRIVA
jgi:uncharacterized protein (TIRG00374 family)